MPLIKDDKILEIFSVCTKNGLIHLDFFLKVFTEFNKLEERIVMIQLII
jgi:hypothetical protein